MKTLPAGSLKKQLPGCELTGPTSSGPVGAAGGGAAVDVQPVTASATRTSAKATRILRIPQKHTTSSPHLAMEASSGLQINDQTRKKDSLIE
ncbi:MAG: hypothetical protein MUC58_06465 [Rhizobiaceae bacterium]|jgi:hypothetical protein|nr:hypothetical protein [Rhizobiaceae bacterium]